MYIIINNKKYNVLLMNTFLKRLKGLMFKKEPIISIYLFPKCSSIHTYFMKQSIDVCILDKNYCVTYLEKNVKPRRIIIKKGYYTLEMPLKSTSNISIGDKIEIKNMK